jgi:hypothetical protein
VRTRPHLLHDLFGTLTGLTAVQVKVLERLAETGYNHDREAHGGLELSLFRHQRSDLLPLAAMR